VKVLGKRTAAVLCPGWRARLSISYIYEEAMDTLTKLELPVKLPAQQIQAITRALSDPRRFQILQQIASHTCSPCSELRASFPISAATISHHMKELEASGLIQFSRRASLWTAHSAAIPDELSLRTKGSVQFDYFLRSEMSGELTGILWN
jgi:ArsR family transcriptional regulator